MSNLSTPRLKVATIKSLLKGHFNADYKPTASEVRGAVEKKQLLAAKRGAPVNIHRDGRLFEPYQRFSNPQKKIGKGNGERV